MMLGESPEKRLFIPCFGPLDRFGSRFMKSVPNVGLTGEARFVVEAKHAIEFAEGGMPAVLSTPSLIGVIERTARQSLAPLLDANERTVGMEIELRHLAPTPVGATVTVTVRVIRSEGREATFAVEARDGQETIARGVHKRAVIRVESFAKRIAAKQAGLGTG
jgi:predicted thioesterase